MSWATKPTLASCAGPSAGRPPSTSIVPAGRLQHADGEVQQRALAGAVGADEPDDASGGDVQRAVRERVAAAVALAQSLGLDRGGHATCRLAEERKVAMNSASMLSSSSPDSRALFIQRCRS